MSRVFFGAPFKCHYLFLNCEFSIYIEGVQYYGGQPQQKSKPFLPSLGHDQLYQAPTQFQELPKLSQGARYQAPMMELNPGQICNEDSSENCFRGLFKESIREEHAGLTSLLIVIYSHIAARLLLHV